MSSWTRRSLLVAAGSALAASAMVRALRAAEGPSPDQMLDELIRENQDYGIGSGFDNASRNVKLPKKSLPTLSPSTAETTQASIAQYEAIVAKGGWPQVPPADGCASAPKARRCRLCGRGFRSRAILKPIPAIRRCSIPMSTSRVRRFQVRHGLHADGVVREPTLARA